MKGIPTAAMLVWCLSFWCFHSGGATDVGFLRDEARVHDPSTIVKGKDEYWSFSTGPGISSRRSRDLVHWTKGPPVFSNVPAWTKSVSDNRGYFWAPDVIQLTHGYFLYYSVSSFGKNTSAIGLATTPTLDPSGPNYGWEDRGVVMRSATNDNFNAIDPGVLLDGDGLLWMAFGSFWAGIKLIELNPRTGLVRATNAPVHSLAWHDSIEAACLYHHGDSYYLFVNWGLCCRGTNSTYEIRVGRSGKITGPYTDREGKNMLTGGGDLFLSSAGKRIGPGHAAVFRENGKEFLSYHYYNAESGGRPRLEIVPLSWTAKDWPEAGEPLGVSPSVSAPDQ